MAPPPPPHTVVTPSHLQRTGHTWRQSWGESPLSYINRLIVKVSERVKISERELHLCLTEVLMWQHNIICETSFKQSHLMNSCLLNTQAVISPIRVKSCILWCKAPDTMPPSHSLCLCDKLVSGLFVRVCGKHPPCPMALCPHFYAPCFFLLYSLWPLVVLTFHSCSG